MRAMPSLVQRGSGLRLVVLPARPRVAPRGYRLHSSTWDMVLMVASTTSVPEASSWPPRLTVLPGQDLATSVVISAETICSELASLQTGWSWVRELSANEFMVVFPTAEILTHVS